MTKYKFILHLRPDRHLCFFKIKFLNINRNSHLNSYQFSQFSVGGPPYTQTYYSVSCRKYLTTCFPIFNLCTSSRLSLSSCQCECLCMFLTTPPFTICLIPKVEKLGTLIPHFQFNSSIVEEYGEDDCSIGPFL